MNLFALVLSALLSFEAVPLPPSALQDAIHHLARHRVGPRTVKQYARVIQQEARRRRVDALLVVAFIHVETARRWDPRTKSTTNDYGLTQVHVAARGSERFLGREHELYDPRTNIREWVRLAAMWRAYHERECEVREQVCYEGIPGVWEQSWCVTKIVRSANHPWWAHLKWGYRVKDTEHARKVANVYRRLLQRLHRPFMSS